MAANQEQSQTDLLVKEMGFARAEAAMAIADCDGNVELAIEKLLAGNYSLPSYAETVQDAVVSSDDVNLKWDPDRADHRQESTGPKNDYGFDTNPPPYTKVCLETELSSWEIKSPATFCKLDSSYRRNGGDAFARCSTCFDEIYESEKSGMTNKAVKDGIRNYHYDCYMKSKGPKCSHCCFPLSKPDLDKNLSGKFLVYNGNNYHVECYEKYAGPRCSYCFNVIIEKPTEEFTGHWIGEGNKMFHEECFYKKRLSEERARCS